MKLFSENQRFYKGNLHTHTKLSDGRKTPEEAAALYKAHGYDFVSFTDHRKLFRGYEEPDFIVLSGGEYHHQPGVTAYHIVGIGMTEEVISTDADSPQEIINKVIAAGGFPILAHPSWSLMGPEDGLALSGYRAVEIYNGITDGYDGNRALSDTFIDVCAARGRLTGIIADDDAHFYEGFDECQGWICLQADEFSTKGILEALYAERYYSSTGPALHQITLNEETGVIRVECDPVEKISFMTNVWFTGNRNVRAAAGETITSAEYKVNRGDRWVRIEGVDGRGKRFWSNFLRL